MRASEVQGLQVGKAVYVSTTKSQLNLTNRKNEEENPIMTFPDMSFAVDNFEEAFESLVSLNALAVVQVHNDHTARVLLPLLDTLAVHIVAKSTGCLLLFINTQTFTTVSHCPTAE